ncbi:MAG: DUF1624 domain-containing protein [Acidobacteriales bacterium]|nr:DUF1624 domain-containing protein [Terriglobales bacterium]
MSASAAPFSDNVSQAAATATTNVIDRSARVASVDLLRGLIMVFMALDHVRDFFTELRIQPEDVTQSFLGLFFTRWITHFSAPGFFFLAGTGAYLYARKRTTSEVSRFLWTRGLWLVFLEATIVFWGWTFMFPLPGLGLLVIWALGMSMVFLSVIVRLPLKWIAVVGLTMIFGHNLLDYLRPEMFGKLAWLWQVLHQQGFIFLGMYQGQPIGFFVLYPLVPWIGVMAAGYAFGAIVARPPEERQHLIFQIGAAAFALFVVLRATNLYGNAMIGAGFVSPGPFVVQPTWDKTIIAFFNVEKYPPSLQFILMTLGLELMALSWFDRLSLKGAGGWLADKITVYGRVPMAYYLMHLYLIHIMAIVVAIVCGQPYKWLLWGGFFASAPQSGYGHGLPFIYAMWLLAVVILYFPCKAYADYKARSKKWWLSYL